VGAVVARKARAMTGISFNDWLRAANGGQRLDAQQATLVADDLEHFGVVVQRRWDFREFLIAHAELYHPMTDEEIRSGLLSVGDLWDAYDPPIPQRSLNPRYFRQRA
jgi:hypothetical protein